MTRRWLSWTLVAVTLSLSACLDDPAVRERLGVDENGRPLGTPSPTATSSSSPSPEPSTAVTPSASPVAPGVTGRYEKTFDPLDLAIAGPGYFVLSTRPNPQSFDEVLFTRRGEFELAFVPASSPAPGGAVVSGPGEWRLQTAEGLYVLGFSDGGDAAAVPPESRSTDFSSAFTLGSGSGRIIRAASIAVSATANANFQPSFNFKGQLLSQQQPVLSPDGQPLQIYMAIAQFDRPEALRPQSGFPAYRYNRDAGVVSVGLAGVPAPPAGLPRPVGDANLIRPQTLER